MKYRQRTNQNNMQNVPLSKRRLKTKPVLTLLAILFAGNIFWFVLWLFALGNDGDNGDSETIVASVSGEKITRQQWMAEMERYYGKETLQHMVNEKVMKKAAKEFGIDVSDEEIDLELSLMIASSEMDSSLQQLGEEELKKQIQSQLILEKVLTKDVIINEEDMEKYYKENESFYNIPTTYRAKLIVVNTKKDAEKVLKELDEGSDFSVLARERSVEQVSASLGGDIGYISKQSNVDPAILKALQQLKENEISSPVLLRDGRYGIVQLNEKKEGKSFKYEEVKNHIKRVLAMEQLPTSITPELFWKEFDVTWFYGE
ncbi:peptidyl-prolyl cis-trans isomerase [Ureibacillus thermophilus]|nr:peptidyl-prolyl cis-trans isomerase [Ureibacillus thermophilus]